MRAFTCFVRSLIGENNNIRILSSNELRSCHSAQVIADTLGISCECIHYSDVLYSSEIVKPQLKEALDLINLEEDEVVIIVTHLEYTKELHRYFGVRVLNTPDFPHGHLEKGEAWCINCDPVEIQPYTVAD
jgi:phosphohistidine phosphatase SixA